MIANLSVFSEKGKFSSGTIFGTYFPIHGCASICTGTIPKELGNLVALTHFYADDNGLTGEPGCCPCARPLPIATIQYLSTENSVGLDPELGVEITQCHTLRQYEPCSICGVARKHTRYDVDVPEGNTREQCSVRECRAQETSKPRQSYFVFSWRQYPSSFPVYRERHHRNISGLLNEIYRC